MPAGDNLGNLLNADKCSTSRLKPWKPWFLKLQEPTMI